MNDFENDFSSYVPAIANYIVPGLHFTAFITVRLSYLSIILWGLVLVRLPMYTFCPFLLKVAKNDPSYSTFAVTIFTWELFSGIW